MEPDIDQETLLIDAAIAQLKSGLAKTYVPFTDIQVWEDRHIAFAQRLEAVCEQEGLSVLADRLVSRFGWHCLEIELIDQQYYFPSISV
jgi:hypothetical protein